MPKWRAIPRYFFNLEGSLSHSDDVGTVCNGLDEARDLAVLAAGETMKELHGFWDQPEWRMHVADEQGGTVCILSIKGTTGEP